MVKKKTKEDKKLKWAKESLEHKKRVYETYKKALVKYNMESIAYASIMYEDLWHNSLLRLSEGKEGQKKLAKLMFGEKRDKKPTELEIIEEEIKYIDKLIKNAQSMVNNIIMLINPKIPRNPDKSKLPNRKQITLPNHKHMVQISKSFIFHSCLVQRIVLIHYTKYFYMTNLMNKTFLYLLFYDVSLKNHYLLHIPQTP